MENIQLKRPTDFGLLTRRTNFEILTRPTDYELLTLPTDFEVLTLLPEFSEKNKRALTGCEPGPRTFIVRLVRDIFIGLKREEKDRQEEIAS